MGKGDRDEELTPRMRQEASREASRGRQSTGSPLARTPQQEANRSARMSVENQPTLAQDRTRGWLERNPKTQEESEAELLPRQVEIEIELPESSGSGRGISNGGKMLLLAAGALIGWWWS